MFVIDTSTHVHYHICDWHMYAWTTNILLYSHNFLMI